MDTLTYTALLWSPLSTITRCPPLSTRSASTSSSSSTGSSAPSPPSSSSRSSQRLAARLCSNSAPSTRAGWRIQNLGNTNTQIYKDFPLTLVYLLEQLWREFFCQNPKTSNFESSEIYSCRSESGFSRPSGERSSTISSKISLTSSVSNMSDSLSVAFDKSKSFQKSTMTERISSKERQLDSSKGI